MTIAHLESLNPWQRYNITLRVKNRLVGGIPNDPKLIEGWLKAAMPKLDDAERAKLKEATLAELPAATEERASGLWPVFKCDPHGIYLEGRQLKAMFKEAANILRDTLMKAEKGDKAANDKKSRYTNLRARVAEHLFVEEDRIHIKRDGKNMAKADGNEEKPIHVMTAQGPRDALKRFDFVDAPAEVSFTVRTLSSGVVDEALLKVMLEYAGWNGLGADRSQGAGQFELVTLSKI